MTKKELKERGDALVNRVEDLTKEVFRRFPCSWTEWSTRVC
jgi:hypothetical protein